MLLAYYSKKWKLNPASKTYKQGNNLLQNKKLNEEQFLLTYDSE